MPDKPHKKLTEKIYSNVVVKTFASFVGHFYLRVGVEATISFYEYTVIGPQELYAEVSLHQPTKSQARIVMLHEQRVQVLSRLAIGLHMCACACFRS